MTPTKQDFAEYAAMVREARLIRQRLAGAAELTDTVRGSLDEYPYTEHTITLEGRNAAQEDELRKRLATLDARIQAVDEAIQAAPNSLLRVALTLKYHEGLTWRDIAAQIGGGATEEGIKKKIARFLKSVPNVPNVPI